MPVLDAQGATVGAIGLSTPASRWQLDRHALTELCCDIGARASNVMRGAPENGGAGAFGDGPAPA